MMNTTIKNIFGIAAAIIVLLSLNVLTSDNSISLPDYDIKVETAENRPVGTLSDFNDAIVDIAEKTNPAVVTITTKKTKEVRVFNPFSQFFGNPYQDEGDNTREYIQRGLGSGVIISEEGYVITNNHVINDTDEIRVRLFDGNEVTAELIGTDPETDIAVLQIDVDNVPTVKMGNSDNLKVGSLVLAIGSPLSKNLAHTVSFGIVSAMGRSLNLTPYGDYIQTDAAINPGNSGGALIDVNGELIGINSAIASRSGGNDGIGFAIPINLAKRIMNDLIEDGEVSRGYLGMYTGGEVDQTMARALGLKDVRGVIVGQVQDDSPADKAGLKEKDIIVTLNGADIKSWDNFRTQIASKKPGDEITLGIIRNKESIELKVTLGNRPDNEAVASTVNPNNQELDERLGFTVRNMNSQFRNQLNIENDVEGVFVSKISEGSKAYERGLRQNDVILNANQQKINSVKEFYSEVQQAIGSNQDVLLLTIYRNNLKQYIAFEL